MTDIYENFEKPEEVVYNYISALDYEQLSKKLSLRKAIKITIIVLLILALICSVCFSIFCYKAYLDSQESIISEHFIVIE